MSKALQTMEWMAPGGNLNAYIQGTATVPMLTIDEERALGESLYYDEDLDAARRMVMAHLRFVVHIARSYNGYGLPLADLIQEGNVGLMKAVRRFNPEKGARLVSFAVHWIKAEIHEFILRNWRIVKIATTKAQRKLFFNLRSAKKQLQWLTADEAEAVAEDLGVTASGHVIVPPLKIRSYALRIKPLTKFSSNLKVLIPTSFTQMGFPPAYLMMFRLSCYGASRGLNPRTSRDRVMRLSTIILSQKSSNRL